jgi:glutamine synthetase
MLRVPAPGRIENRGIDSSCNPYLAVAAKIAAGRGGVQRGQDPGAPQTGAASSLGARVLPRTLVEALDELEVDTVLRDALGEEALAEFIAVKRMEWASYMETVTGWEYETYLRRT